MAKAERKHTSTETISTDQNEAKPYLVTHQILDFLLFIIEGFLLLRFLLQLSGASRAAGFVQFVYNVSEIFMLPFRFIFPASQTGQVIIEWSVLLAMLVYALLFYTIRRAVGIAQTADTTESP